MAMKKPAFTDPAVPWAVSLYTPGLIPMMRAGLGGLASALYEISRNSESGAEWPSRIPMGKGVIKVEAHQITFDWQGRPPIETLNPLFKSAFRVNEGVIYLTGSYDVSSPLRLCVRAQLQKALFRTF